MRKTKIVATLGPANSSVEVIKQLIKSGLDGARINFSHVTKETHNEVSEMIDRLKQAREELGKPIPLILDTKGPEIRIKKFTNGEVFLAQGNEFTLTTRDVEGDETIVSVTYANLPKDLKENSRVLVDDGLIELKVKNISETDILCEIVNSGNLSSRKGINVPDVYVNLPSLTEQDIEDIKFGISVGFDYIAASFIRSAADVLKIRDVLEENGGEKIRIIAKIESRDGVNNVESILEVADGIMVARGDLGVEIPPEEVPLVQKMLIKTANLMGKPVITATQMLESMVMNLRPTRAEANDVANAIYDGSDAIMLSGETAKGKYPVESVKMMVRIAVKAEESIDYNTELLTHHRSFKTNITNAISYATCTTAADLNTACIVTVTESGFTARMISKFKPGCPILAVTKDQVAWRQSNIIWGCVPELCYEIQGNDEVFDIAVKKAVETGLAKNGDTVVIAAGVPVGVASTTNTMRVHIVGNVLVKGRGLGNKTVSGYTSVIKVIEQAEKYFKKGDVLVVSKTTNELMPYIKKASAIIVGCWEPFDFSHTETISQALDIPVVICGEGVVDLIPDGIAVTVDSVLGFVYNGKNC